MPVLWTVLYIRIKLLSLANARNDIETKKSAKFLLPVINSVLFLSTDSFFYFTADRSTCTAVVASDQPTADVRTQTNGSSSTQAFWPVGRRGHTAVLYGNSMYIYGGYIDMKGSSAELWQFSFEETMCWTCVSPSAAASEVDSPVGRHSHSAVVHRHRMWVFGGLSGLTALDDLWTWHFGEYRTLYSCHNYCTVVA